MKKKWKKIVAIMLILTLSFGVFQEVGRYYVSAGDMKDKDINEYDKESATETAMVEGETGTGEVDSEDTTEEETTTKKKKGSSKKKAKTAAETETETETEVSTERETTQAESTTEPQFYEETPQNEPVVLDTAGSKIPTTEEELIAKGEKEYAVATYDDVLALQALSQTTSLEGYTFKFGKLNNQETHWYLNTLNGFTGFGCEAHPFRGIIEEAFKNSVTFHLGAKPFFQYVGSGVTVTDIEIEANSSMAGMADTLLITDDKPITYNNVKLKGTVVNNNGNAGALYGTVRSSLDTVYNLYIDGNGLDVTGITVTGAIAGGYIGEVTGNIKLVVSSGTNVAKSVKASNNGIAGGIVGKLGNGSSFEVASEITIANTISSANTQDNSCVGGLIGVCENATVTSVNKVTKNTETYVGKVAGGYIGQAVNSNITISDFILKGNVSAKVNTGAYAGGVVGHYVNNAGDSGSTSLKISHIGISGAKIAAGAYYDNRYINSGDGGVIGYIQGDNVTISDISSDTGDEYAFLPDLAWRADYINNYTNAAGKRGGIAGIIEGKNITISNIVVAFTSSRAINGHYLGCIAGYANAESKIKMQQIQVKSNYVSNTTPSSVGGIIGYVEKGCILSLADTIDLSGIDYRNNRNGLYGTNRGYVAGYQTESLIYLEEGAALKHNTEVEDKDNSVWTADYYGSNPGNLLDDIGSYGSVYHNVKDKNDALVIQYDQPYGQEVTGTVPYTGTAYQLTEDADALRLAIALNTFDASSADYTLRFAQNCFQAGTTAKTLLSVSYQVTGDLDFANTGIYSLCRNDSNTAYVFTGNIEGVSKADGTSPVISLYMISKQNYGGLFTKVSGSTFKNLHLSGYLYYVKNFGGIATYAEGNITLEGITTDMRMRTSSNSNNINSNLYYYGGLIAHYNLQADTFISQNCVIAPIMDNVRMQQMAGGMIGWLQTTNKTVSNDNISISDITIKTQIKAAVNFNYNPGDYPVNQVRTAGMIAQISYDVKTNLHDWSALGGNYKDATCAKVVLSGITVDGSDMDMSLVNANKANVRSTGGFLGYDWNNVEVTIGDVTVSGNSSIKSLGHVGGLITTLTGKLDFNGNVSLDSMSMKDILNNSTFSSLLIGDGRNAVITITEANYKINADKVTVTGYSNFDEIVGVNCELANNYINYNGWNLSGDYKNGGILNIIKPEFKNMTLDGYDSYENKLVTQTNKYTRYYYNLFGGDYAANKVVVSGGQGCIDTPEKLMLWHLYQYSNQYIKHFLTPYFINDAGDMVSVPANWKFTGVLDMKGYSFYPSKVLGGTYDATGAVLVLYGEDIERQESAHVGAQNQKRPSEAAKQHYMMHAGLFAYTTGNVIIKELTLQGTATNLGGKSGALFAGGVSGGMAQIINVTCDGIRLSNYTDGTAAGLLVGTVADGATLKMDGVTTTSEYDDDITEGRYVAAALIGTVGSTTARNVHVSFKNMKVEDEKGKVFKYASFIYNYNSVDDSNVNKSTGLYTFTKADFNNGNVTFGSELSYGVEYYDMDKAVSGDPLQDVIDEAAAKYNPYVYMVKDILVNPRNGDLTEGCGTYEDPYVISNTRQFLTLYCYLTGINTVNGGKVQYSGPYSDILTGSAWSVNPIGGGSADGRCNKDTTPHTAIVFDAAGNNAGFPTIDEMRKAYYIITEDVDMSRYSDLNEYTLEKDFSGLGTTINPFSGVLIGKKIEGGAVAVPTITLPKSNKEKDSQEKDVYWNTYGLIAYMDGAVVKNLNIKTPDTTDVYDNKMKIAEGGSGGGVAAVVLGGDNIIDNVSVNIQFRLSSVNNNTATDAKAKTGGYVGYVKKGSVIVRTMQHTDVEKYAAYLKDGTTVIDGTNHEKYIRNCRVIGWVEDGCVMYEGTLSAAQKAKQVLEQNDFGYADDTIPLSYSFPMVNGAYLEENCNDTTGKIQIADDGSGGYTITMQNAAQLEIAALALNSDAFSIYDSGTVDANHTNGYNHTAICRKAEYNNVGGSVTGADCQNAIQNDDNKGYYPYLYWKYMDFSNVAGGYEATQVVDGAKRLSKLNWSDGSAANYGNVNIGNVTVTYQLVKDDAHPYDVSGYGRGFRGFGALYHTTYSMFKANFNGNDAIVTINMNRDWDSTVTTTGMFNDLTTYRSEGFTISNIHLLNSGFDSSQTTSSSTGAIAGNIKGVWNFNGIVFEQGIITSSSYLGGMAGRMNYYSTSAGDSPKQQITFTDCKVSGTAGNTCTFLAGGTSGGMVGYVEGRTDKNTTYFGTLTFNNCSVQYSEITLQTGKTGNLGGFIGRVGHLYNNTFNSSYGHSVGIVNIIQTDSGMTTVGNTKIYSGSQSASSVGGLIGMHSSIDSNKDAALLTISGVYMDSMELESATPYANRSGVGGLVGGAWSHYMDIRNVKVTDSVMGRMDSSNRLPTGGIIGVAYADYVDITDADVEGCSIATYGTTSSNNYAYAGGYIGDSQITTKLTVTSANSANHVNALKGTTIKSYNWAAGGIIGSNSVGTPTNWILSDITVENAVIYSHANESGGDVQLTELSDNYAAGGILGRNHQRIQQLDLNNITVGSGTEIAANSAGGLIGWLTNSANKVNLTGRIYVGCHADGTEDTNGAAIFGYRRAGGLYGYQATNATENSSADVRIYNTKIGAYSRNNNYTAIAGGVAGWRDIYQVSKYDNLEIKNCLIAANHSNTGDVMISVGGVYGYMGQGNSSYIYHPKLTDNSIGYLSTLTGMKTLKDTTNISDTVKLLGGTAAGTAKHWQEVDNGNGITEANVGTYSLKIGNYLGQRASGNLYILRPELDYASGFTGSRPAIDVGNGSTGTTNYDTAYGYGYPYAWRQWCHIVYFEPTMTTENLVADELIQSSENEYLYSSIDDIMTKYNSGTASGEEFLNAYKLNVNMKDPIEGNKKKISDYYDKFVKSHELNGVKVVYADGGTAQSIMDSVAGTLTNTGGIAQTPSSIKNYLSISVFPAKITADGKIVKSNQAKSLSVDSNNNFSYSRNYDELLSDNSYTISLVALRYGWIGADNQQKYETVYVPVFVVERIDFYNDIHIMEGEQYSMTDAHDSTKSYSGKVTVAHDSTYTLFAEMAYGKGRKKASYQSYIVKKTLKFQRDDGVVDNAVIPEGVKLTLVDVQTQTPYYYTVEAGGTSSIDFELFKDVNGSTYQNRMMSEITSTATSFKYGGTTYVDDFGLEQFYIYVDASESDLDPKVFRVSVNTDSTSPTALNFFNRSESTGIQITSEPGLEIQFYDKGNAQQAGRTYVSGEISKSGKIQIDTSIEIKAGYGDIYWNEKRDPNIHFIDSQNNNKYLDVAIYLIDNQTGKYVTLPANTNIIVNNQVVASVGQSVMYTYKDWNNTFQIDNVTEDIAGEHLIIQDDGTEVSNECHIELDFSVADIDEYVSNMGKDYSVQLELRRTSDPRYPLGGDLLDKYSAIVLGKGSKEMAVALDVSKMMDLGMNTYQQTSSAYQVDFSSKLDFSGMIGISNTGVPKQADIDLCAGRKYLITYRLKKKVKLDDGTYQYVSAGMDGAPTDMKLGDELKLNFDDGAAWELKQYSNETVYQTVKTFTADEITSGTDGVKYVVEWDGSLEVDTEDISTIDFSNYKVEITVLPYDAAQADAPITDENATLIDYFIYTLAKLKTDI